MTDFTTILGLPKPESTDSPNGPVQVGALADALDDELAKIQTKRVSTGSVAAGGTALVTATWDRSFGDTNYTVAALVALGMTTTAAVFLIDRLEQQSATAVGIIVRNTSATPRTGTLHVIGIHE